MNYERILKLQEISDEEQQLEAMLAEETRQIDYNEKSYSICLPIHLWIVYDQLKSDPDILDYWVIEGSIRHHKHFPELSFDQCVMVSIREMAKIHGIRTLMDKAPAFFL